MSKHVPTPQTLKAMQFFKSFTDVELEQFLGFADPSDYRSGEFIIRQGEDGDCMFCLAEGTCKAMVSHEGNYSELAVFEPGAIFGELAVFEHRPRFADVIAVTDCVLLKISEPMVHAFAGIHPAAAYKLLAGIIREIGQRLRNTSTRVLDSLMPAIPLPKA
jgi:CRP-like cAMP-binding protein